MAHTPDTMSHAEQMTIYETLLQKKPCTVDKVRGYLNPMNFCFPKLSGLGFGNKRALKLTSKYQVFFNALDNKLLTPLEHYLEDGINEEYAP